MSHFKINWQTKALALKNVFTIARGSRTHQHNVFIQVEKDGITGFGEASPNKRYNETPETVSEELKHFSPAVLEGVSLPEEVEQALDQFVFKNQSTKIALEMAWLDWWAKSQEQPLWKLWGGKTPAGPISSFTIGIDSFEMMQKKILEAKKYPLYKIKLGTDHDREIIQAIREVTDKPIRVDANEGWKTVDQALTEIEFLKSQNVELVEQPMHASMVEELKELKQNSILPLCADESFTGNEDLDEIAECFHIINIKLMKIGSMVKARRVIRQAHQLGLEVMIGCMIESSLANTAGAVIALDAEYADLDGHVLISNDPYKGLEILESGHIRLSSMPGLGVTASH